MTLINSQRDREAAERALDRWGAWRGLAGSLELRESVVNAIEAERERIAKFLAAFGPEATAPNNRRLLVFGHMPAGHEEMAMGWKDVLDDQWYFSPQGGLVPFTVEQWCEVPQPPERADDQMAAAPVPDLEGPAEVRERGLEGE